MVISRVKISHYSRFGTPPGRFRPARRSLRSRTPDSFPYFPTSLPRYFFLSYLHTGTFARLISFVCHSYEKVPGCIPFFPFRNFLSSPPTQFSIFAFLFSISPNSFNCHTSVKTPHKSFPCHTSKNAALKVLSLPHLRHPPGGSIAFAN